MPHLFISAHIYKSESKKCVSTQTVKRGQMPIPSTDNSSRALWLLAERYSKIWWQTFSCELHTNVARKRESKTASHCKSYFKWARERKSERNSVCKQTGHAQMDPILPYHNTLRMWCWPSFWSSRTHSRLIRVFTFYSDSRQLDTGWGELMQMPSYEW